jgi:hypothetical protein
MVRAGGQSFGQCGLKVDAQMNQRGIADGWLILIGLAVVLGLVVTGLGYIKGFADREYKRGKQEVQAKFDLFKAETAELGRKAQTASDAEKARNAVVSKERKSSYEKRIADLAADYQRLCSESGSCSGKLPAVPATARSPDDAARDQQLSAVLRHADEQTARLVELQEWVKQQAK